MDVEVSLDDIPTEEIKQQLMQRGIPTEYVEWKARHELMEMYKKLVVALPQRSRRTKILTVSKRKGDREIDSPSYEKIQRINNGINDLTITRPKDNFDDDPMRGS